MSSIPLSRILATKKTNGELEKEQFDKQMVNIVQFCFYIYSGFLLLVFAYFVSLLSVCFAQIENTMRFPSNRVVATYVNHHPFYVHKKAKFAAK